VVIYIPTILYKYFVITDHDLIWHKYYITGTYKSTIYKRFTRINWDQNSRSSRTGRTF